MQCLAIAFWIIFFGIFKSSHSDWKTHPTFQNWFLCLSLTLLFLSEFQVLPSLLSIHLSEWTYFLGSNLKRQEIIIMPPSKVKTAFQFFQAENIKAIKASLGSEASMGSAMTELSSRWRSMSAPLLDSPTRTRRRRIVIALLMSPLLPMLRLTRNRRPGGKIW